MGTRWDHILSPPGGQRVRRWYHSLQPGWIPRLVGTYDRYDWDGLNCVYLQTVQNFVGGLIDILTDPHAFVALSVTETDLGCPSGTFGFGAKVKYLVTGLAAVPVRQAGMTPRENVFINGLPTSFFFEPFATPPTTDSLGTFTDIPIGSCFPGSPFSTLNPCVSVKQEFDIVVPNDPNSPRSIITQTLRKDCRRGIRVEVQNGPVSETFTLGEVP